MGRMSQSFPTVPKTSTTHLVKRTLGNVVSCCFCAILKKNNTQIIFKKWIKVYVKEKIQIIKIRKRKKLKWKKTGVPGELISSGKLLIQDRLQLKHWSRQKPQLNIDHLHLFISGKKYFHFNDETNKIPLFVYQSSCVTFRVCSSALLMTNTVQGFKSATVLTLFYFRAVINTAGCRGHWMDFRWINLAVLTDRPHEYYLAKLVIHIFVQHWLTINSKPWCSLLLPSSHSISCRPERWKVFELEFKNLAHAVCQNEDTN